MHLTASAVDVSSRGTTTISRKTLRPGGEPTAATDPGTAQTWIETTERAGGPDLDQATGTHLTVPVARLRPLIRDMPSHLISQPRVSRGRTVAGGAKSHSARPIPMVVRV